MTDEESKTLNVLTLHAEIEKLLQNALVKTPHGLELQVNPQLGKGLLEAIDTSLQYCLMEGYRKTAILCDPRYRFQLRRYVEKRFPGLPVISYAEVAPGYKINVLKTIALDKGYEHSL